MRQSQTDIIKKSEYFARRAKDEKSLAPDIVQLAGSGNGGGSVAQNVYKVVSVSTVDATYGPHINVQALEMKFSTTLGYYWDVPTSPVSSHAYPYPGLDVLFYNSFVAGDPVYFIGHNINGIVFLDAQPWSIY